MKKPPHLRLSFPPNLSDEAAYEIFEFLEALTLAFEERYLGQILRHRRVIYPTRSESTNRPWEDDDGGSL